MQITDAQRVARESGLERQSLIRRARRLGVPIVTAASTRTLLLSSTHEINRISGAAAAPERSAGGRILPSAVAPRAGRRPGGQS